VTSFDAAAFCEACGLTEPLRLSVNQEGNSSPGQLFTLDRPFFLAGQDLHCQVHLPGPGIRRRQLYGQAIEGQIFLVDLGARPGLRWGSEPCLAGWLGNQAPVFVGRCSLTRTDADLAFPRTDRIHRPSPLEFRPADPQALPSVSLELTNSAGEKTIWMMSRVLGLIGKMGICKLRLRHSSISHLHASLVRTHQGVWIVDLLSREGTLVNGVPIRFARLQDKDRLRIGSVELLVSIGPNRPIPKQLLFVPPLGKVAPAASDASEPLLPLPLASSLAEPGLPRPHLELPAGLLARMDPSLVQVLLKQFRNLQQQMFDQYQQSLHFLVQMMANGQQRNHEEIQQEVAALRQLVEELRTLKAQATPGVASVGPSRKRLESTPLPSAKPGSPAPENTHPPQGAETPAAVPAETGEAHLWLSRRIVELQEEQQTRWTRLLRFVFGP
jgi:hypothetical protein